MTLGPYGVGHLDGKAVLVPNSAPGDVLTVAAVHQRRDWALARIEALVRPGPQRRAPPCPYLPRCGGCDWQQIAYPAQVSVKSQLLAAELGRALGTEIDSSGLIEPAPAEFGYRSRVRFQVGRGGRLGFHELGSNRLVEVDRCLVAAPGLAVPHEMALALGAACREIEVVQAPGARQVMVAHLARAPGRHELAAARLSLERDPKIAGVVLRGGRRREVLGDPRIAVEIETGLEVEVDADLFSQVNHAQNRALVALVMELSGAGAGLAVLDLFCGAGNLSLPVARRGAEVLGVDAEPLAAAAAACNARRLGLAQARFVALAAADTARFLERAGYRPGLVMLDPPRRGAPDLMASIGRLRPPAVLYVSCEVATLARDLKALIASGYRPDRVRALDFFPNTHHAEVVARMVLT